MTRTLLVKTHAFGDALLCTPAAAGLVKAGDRVTVLAGPSSLPVWQRMPGMEAVRSVPFPPESPMGALRLVAWTLRVKPSFRFFNRVVYLGRSPAVRRWLRFLTGAIMRSGGDVPLGEWESVFPQKEGELASAAFARMAGVEPDSLTPRFPLAPGEMDLARKKLGDDEWLVIAPGGGDNPRDIVAEKRWLPGRFAEVCRKVIDRGIRVVLLGGPGDTGAAAAVERGAPGVLNLTGTTTWGETAALTASAGRFLGVDSGPAHLATAVGADAVVMFGPTAPGCLYAPGLVRPLLSPANCSPCYASMPFPGCAKEGGCMEMITVDMVMEVLGPVLEGVGG